MASDPNLEDILLGLSRLGDIVSDPETSSTKIKTTTGDSKVQSQRSAFEALPGEIRNLIYDFYYRDGISVVFKSKHEPKAMLNENNKSLAANASGRRAHHVDCAARLGRFNLPSKSLTNWTTSWSSLSLVSKSIHRETEMFMYKYATFHFQDSGRLRLFLRVTRDSALKHVMAMHIVRRPYGEPGNIHDAQWKMKYEASFFNACRTAALKCPNLIHLHMVVDTNDSPLLYRAYCNWLTCAYAFSPYLGLDFKDEAGIKLVEQRVREGRYLKDFQLTIYTSSTNPTWKMHYHRHLRWFRATHPEFFASQVPATRLWYAEREMSTRTLRHITKLFAASVKRLTLLGESPDEAFRNYHWQFRRGGRYEHVSAPFLVKNREIFNSPQI